MLIGDCFVVLDILSSAVGPDGGKKANIAETLAKNLTEAKKFIDSKSAVVVDTGSVGEGSETDHDHDHDHEVEVGDASIPFVDDFLQTCFDVCARICGQSEEEEEDRLWSVKEEATMKRTLQLMVALGILPNLRPNVGVPLDRRTSMGVKFAGFEDEVI